MAWYEWQKRIAILALLAAIAWSFIAIEFEFVTVLLSFGEAWHYIVTDFVPPEWHNWQMLLKTTLETVFMSYVALCISSVFALVLALFASQTTCPAPWMYPIARAIASLIRSIPTMVWVLLFVVSIGLGITAGVVAMIFGGIGMLTRSFAEVFDEMKPEQMEALRAVGAGWPQMIARAVLPHCAPALIAWFLFGLDLNIRDSAIIGMIGGGGIGFHLQESIKLFQFQSASAILVMIFVLIGSMEWITNQMRRRLL